MDADLIQYYVPSPGFETKIGSRISFVEADFDAVNPETIRCLAMDMDLIVFVVDSVRIHL